MENKSNEQEMYYEYQVLTQEVQQLQQQIAFFNEQGLEIETILNSLNEIKNSKNEEILVPLAGGIFIKANLKDSEKFIVNIGSNITKEMSTLEVRKMLQEQKSELELIKKQLNNTFLEKIKRFTELENYIISHSAKSKKDS
ncbi:prefoldin subunit alpha [Candidatus Woesearchaeota archaeon]|nr:prefoldin subunit alpha [Candidatus Woesearchaeota archaeon]